MQNNLTAKKMRLHVPRELALCVLAFALGQSACVWANTEIVNVLFRSLVDAFAPRPMARKYFRLNVAEVVPPTKPGQLPSYVAIGKLDDTKAVEKLRRMTHDYMARTDVAKLLEDAAKALEGSLDVVKA